VVRCSQSNDIYLILFTEKIELSTVRGILTAVQVVLIALILLHHKQTYIYTLAVI